MKCWAGGLTSWNQDCQEKYQQPQICRWYHSCGRKWRGTKEPLVVERVEWKIWLKAQHSKNKDQGIWSYHFIASRWGKGGNSVRFNFLGLQNQCSPRIKRCLLLGRMANLDSVLKSRDITLTTKIHKVKAIVFPVVMYECERWTIKKAECWRTDPFKLWCRRLLRVPRIARRSSQSILKEINPEYSL